MNFKYSLILKVVNNVSARSYEKKSNMKTLVLIKMDGNIYLYWIFNMAEYCEQHKPCKSCFTSDYFSWKCLNG